MNLRAVSEVPVASPREAILTDQSHPKPAASSAACPIPDDVALGTYSNITINVSPVSITPHKRRFPLFFIVFIVVLLNMPFLSGHLGSHPLS